MSSLHVLLGLPLVIAGLLTFPIGLLVSKRKHYQHDPWFTKGERF